MPGELTLEIVEGPGAGKQITLSGPIVIGRAPDADFVIDDEQASRHHARVTPAADGSATVEDLESINGTFINDNELIGPARIDPGDELQIGVTVLQAHREEDFSRGQSGVVSIPPSLAKAPATPAYVDTSEVDATLEPEAVKTGSPTLDKYLDVRVRRRAQLAPLALFVLIAIALIIYFAAK